MSEDAWHVVMVPVQGHVICSCAGVNWCSHIDATLVAGERVMVAHDERGEANRAQIAARGRIGPPEGWQAHWRSNRRWRGLPPLRPTIADRSIETGCPAMSLEGRGRLRTEIAELSEAAGWLINDRPTRGCLFHVASACDLETPASEAARAAGIPISGYDEWRTLAADLGRIMAHEIDMRSKRNRLQDGSSGE